MNFNPKFTQPSFLFLNLRNVRLLSCGVIGVLLALAGSSPVRSQDDPPPSAQQPVDQYFAGLVTALAGDSITLTRTVLGKATVRSFAITAETVVQPQGGKPKLKQKVTVKWVSEENGDRAVKIILRGSMPPPKKQCGGRGRSRWAICALHLPSAVSAVRLPHRAPTRWLPPRLLRAAISCIYHTLANAAPVAARVPMLFSPRY